MAATRKCLRKQLKTTSRGSRIAKRTRAFGNSFEMTGRRVVLSGCLSTKMRAVEFGQMVSHPSPIAAALLRQLLAAQGGQHVEAPKARLVLGGLFEEKALFFQRYDVGIARQHLLQQRGARSHEAQQEDMAFEFAVNRAGVGRTGPAFRVLVLEKDDLVAHRFRRNIAGEFGRVARTQLIVCLGIGGEGLGVFFLAVERVAQHADHRRTVRRQQYVHRQQVPQARLRLGMPSCRNIQLYKGNERRWMLRINRERPVGEFPRLFRFAFARRDGRKAREGTGKLRIALYRPLVRALGGLMIAGMSMGDAKPIMQVGVRRLEFDRGVKCMNRDKIAFDAHGAGAKDGLNSGIVRRRCCGALVVFEGELEIAELLRPLSPHHEKQRMAQAPANGAVGNFEGARQVALVHKRTDFVGDPQRGIGRRFVGFGRHCHSPG